PGGVRQGGRDPGLDAALRGADLLVRCPGRHWLVAQVGVVVESLSLEGLVRRVIDQLGLVVDGLSLEGVFCQNPRLLLAAAAAQVVAAVVLELLLDDRARADGALNGGFAAHGLPPLTRIKSRTTDRRVRPLRWGWWLSFASRSAPAVKTFQHI